MSQKLESSWNIDNVHVIIMEAENVKAVAKQSFESGVVSYDLIHKPCPISIKECDANGLWFYGNFWKE